MLYRIPLTSVQQELDIDLGDATYHLRFMYNKIAGAWYLDVYDADGNPLVLGTPLVTGANIFDQYLYKGFGGILTLYTDGDADHMPSLDELGVHTKVYWIGVEAHA